MKPLKSLINKSNLKGVSTGNGKWVSSSEISFLDLKDGNILTTEWGLNYVYVSTKIASDLVGHKINTSLDHVFFRKEDDRYRYATLEPYWKTFPRNTVNNKLNVVIVHTHIENFKNTHDLKEYLDITMPKIILGK